MNPDQNQTPEPTPTGPATSTPPVVPITDSVTTEATPGTSASAAPIANGQSDTQAGVPTTSTSAIAPKKKPVLLIVLVAVLVLAAIATAAYFFLGNK